MKQIVLSTKMSFAVCQYSRTLTLSGVPAMSIYNIIPTRLYIKELNGLYYFGKSIKKDILKYNGSGKRWVNHIKKHGKQNIRTIWISDWYYDSSIIDEALSFSTYHQITKSKIWANIIDENGINGGGNCKQMHNTKARKKAIESYNAKSNEEKRQIIIKSKNTIKNKYNVDSTFKIHDDTIQKRNNTNKNKYGSSCAANKNIQHNIDLKRTKYINRNIVIQIKCISKFSAHILKRNWIYLDDADLELQFNECMNRLKYYNITTRNALILRKHVVYIMMLNQIIPLQLKQNWFQQNDNIIDDLYNDVKSNHSEFHDIVLQTTHRYFAKYQQLFGR